MTGIPQGNNAAEKDPAKLLTMALREINGVYTSASRIAIPDDKAYNIENMIPIGAQNLHVVPNISSALFDYSSDPIYLQQSANLNGQEFLINFSVNGNVHLFNVDANTDQVINTNFPLSGASSRSSQWKNTVLLFVDATGYYSYDGTTFQKITGPGVPSSGDAIAVYEGRVWIAEGRLLVNSGADDYTAASFLQVNGAAFVSLTDPQIRTKVQRMIVSNGVLYLVAGTSVNMIYNVQVPTGAVPPTPTYQNENIQDKIGSDQPFSVYAFGSAFMMANRYGVYQVYGVSAPKISDDINGTWKYVDFNQGISGGQVVVSGLMCSAFLIKRLNDPNFGSNTVIALFTQRTAPSSIQSGETVWWFANYGALTSIVGAVFEGAETLFGIIGNRLYRLFADNNNPPSAVVMTKLYPMEDELAAKEVLTAGFGARFFSIGTQIQLTIDTPEEQFPTNAAVNITAGLWINNAGMTGQWVNNTGVIGGWFAQFQDLLFSQTPGVGDRYVGMTLTSTGYEYELNIMAMDYKLRQRWL